MPGHISLCYASSYRLGGGFSKVQIANYDNEKCTISLFVGAS